MSFINGTTYKQLAELYATGYRNQIASSDLYEDAVDVIVQLNVLEPEVDLLDVTYNTFLATRERLTGTTILLSAVRAINNHVINRGGFADINEYLLSESVSDLPSEWGKLSQDAGFPINQEYVEDGS